MATIALFSLTTTIVVSIERECQENVGNVPNLDFQIGTLPGMYLSGSKLRPQFYFADGAAHEITFPEPKG
jgi:hypothetical protein